MNFPTIRLRRTRMTEPLRKLVCETHLDPAAFIYPLFVVPGKNIRKEISSMPGIFQLSIDEAAKEAREIQSLGIGGVILFGIPEKKDDHGMESYEEFGIVQETIRAIKKEAEELVVITDVCLCEYTSHGHCGIVEKKGDHVEIVNDLTLDVLARQALSHAKAGADIVAPSDMMDGHVHAIRSLLDREGFHNTVIMSYAAKYASAFYGPFREAADSTPAFGDRHSHQMDPANSDEALREVALDIEEGADIVIVKPAMSYLDIVRRVKDRFAMPTAAYQVSGEYSMIKAAAKNGWIDGEKAMMESLISIKRAGADIIITYFAKEAAKRCGTSAPA